MVIKTLLIRFYHESTCVRKKGITRKCRSTEITGVEKKKEQNHPVHIRIVSFGLIPSRVTTKEYDPGDDVDNLLRAINSVYLYIILYYSLCLHRNGHNIIL